MVIRKSLLSLSIASVFALTACGSDNDKTPTPEPPVIPPIVVAPETPDALSFVVTGNVINIADSNIVADATINFLEDGVASTNLVDVNGNAITSVTAAEGDFSFTLKEGATITEISAVVSAAGFISKGFNIDLDVADGIKVLPVQLALTSKTGAGITDKTETSTVDAGTVAEAIKVTPDAADVGKVAEVTIPAGVVLQDATGVAVTGTSVTLNVTSSADSASALLPQGLNTAGSDTVATPVGSASVVMMDENGTKIKKFSQEIEVTVQVPESAGVTEGQMLDITSFDEDTGKWTSEGDNKATIGDFNATTKTFPATFMTDHLTIFATTTSQPVCAEDIKLTYSGAAIPTSGLLVQISASDMPTVSYPVFSGTTELLVASADAAALIGVAADATANIKVTDVNGAVWHETSGETTNICGNIAVELANPVTLVAESFALSSTCSNDTTITNPLPGAVVKYRIAGKGFSTASGDGAGNYALNDLVTGSAYDVRVIPRGTAFTDVAIQNFTITADGTDENGTVPVTCDTSTGGTGAG